MRSNNKSPLRRVLTAIGIFVLCAIALLLLMSFVDNAFNGVLLDWFDENYMMTSVESEGDQIRVVREPMWGNVKVLVTVIMVASLAFWLIVLAVVSKLRVRSVLRAEGAAVGEYLLSDEPRQELSSELAAPLSEAKTRLMSSQQMLREETARKNDLVMYLAHDLKTPLSSVIGYLTLLRDEQEISPELREKYLSITLDKAERLEDLINEFFEITRFNLSTVTLEKTRIDLTRLLEQLVFEFMPMLRDKELTVSLDAPQELIISCDADKLQRVFDNLLRNAVLYSYPKTEIGIKAECDGSDVSVSFVNRGAAIPEEKLRRIFEQFYRLDAARSSTGGAGLGLAIAKQIVTLHGGTILARSENDTVEFKVQLKDAKVQ